MSDRRMPSIFPECDKLKQSYDKCFTSFFQQYLNPELRGRSLQNPCKDLLSVYQGCVEKPKIDPTILILTNYERKCWAKQGRTNFSVIRSQNMPNYSSSSGEGNEQRFQVLENTLEQFQENARHIGVLVTNFSSKSQDILNQKIHTMISGLQELNQLKNRYGDVRIPLEVLDSLDAGKNPQLYTATCLERTLQKNKEVNGKTELYKKLHASLIRELSEEMSSDVSQYLKIRRRKETRSEPSPS